MPPIESYQELLASLLPKDGLILIDVDGFGALNASLGEAVAERMLSELAAHLRGAMRGRDAVVRFGGDEFLAVIRDAGTEAFPVVCRLSHSWRTLGPPATFSAGVAIHGYETTPDQTFSDADAALYQAKRNGPGEVYLSPGPVAPNPGLRL